MSRGPSTVASIVVATLAVATIARAAEAPTQQEYVARVEPICQANTLASQRLLNGVQAKVREQKLASAGAQFIRAAAAFGTATSEIAAVPQPPPDQTRLGKWIEHLKLVASYLRKTGRALKRGNRGGANLDVIKLRSSSNAANNVVFDFEFHYCRITASQFS
jgi:hypothetical protein